MPSSNQPRWYQAPSHASRSSAAASRAACARQAAARVGLAARLCQRREGRERRVQEPAEPDALALALRSDAVHAVVPVARADQGEPVDADGEAAVERARAVFEERRGVFADHRLEERIVLALAQRRSFQERNCFVENADVGA